MGLYLGFSWRFVPKYTPSMLGGVARSGFVRFSDRCSREREEERDKRKVKGMKIVYG